jgi:hypothetical protein
MHSYSFPFFVVAGALCSAFIESKIKERLDSFFDEAERLLEVSF